MELTVEQVYEQALKFETKDLRWLWAMVRDAVIEREMPEDD